MEWKKKSRTRTFLIIKEITFLTIGHKHLTETVPLHKNNRSIYKLLQIQTFKNLRRTLEVKLC